MDVTGPSDGEHDQLSRCPAWGSGTSLSTNGPERKLAHPRWMLRKHREGTGSAARVSGPWVATASVEDQVWLRQTKGNVRLPHTLQFMVCPLHVNST